jgi:hypothetical protein
MNSVEVNIMKLLNQKKLTNFPKLLKHGTLAKGPGIIMERFGETLDYYATEEN